MNFVKKVAADFQAAHPAMRIIAQPEYEDVQIDGESPEDHAGLWETSLFWHLHPELTHMDKFNPFPKPSCRYDNPPNEYGRDPDNWRFGDPVLPRACPELGARAVDIISDHIAAKVGEALKELHLR